MVEPVITITGNPFAAKNFFQVHVLPAVAIAVPMKISVTALGNGLAYLILVVRIIRIFVSFRQACMK